MEREANSRRHMGPPGRLVTVDQTQQARDLGIIVSADLKSSLQCQKTTKKAWFTLHQLMRTVKSRMPNFLLPLFEAFSRLHFVCCAQAVLNKRKEGAGTGSAYFYTLVRKF